MKRDNKKSLPSSSSIMDDAGPPIFVVLHYSCRSVVCILQLKTPVNNLEHDAAQLTLEQIEKRQLNETDYVERIDLNDRQPGADSIKWYFAHPTSPNSFMYIMPNQGQGAQWALHASKGNQGPIHASKGNYDRFPGYIYDIKTKEKQDIKSRPHSKSDACVVSCGGRVYFMTHPDSFYPKPHRSFEYYDPDQGKWEPLETYPHHLCRINGNIQATAVWGNTILYNLDASLEFWAYNIPNDKWYLVEVIDGTPVFGRDNRCYTIYGEAVVRENTIYALTTLSVDAVLELSIERINCDGDFAFRLSLVSMILVPGLKPVGFENPSTLLWSRHLVYMGEDNFCLVQSCFFFMLKDFQPLQLTTIKLEENKGEKSMTVTGTCLYEVIKEEVNDRFKFALCFYLPEAEDFKPHGHYIYVRNLPPEAATEELEKKLKKFGPIKRDGIRFNRNETGRYSACVEFESATSKQRAIEASTIKIGGYCAEIEEKRADSPLTQLTPT